jgi:ATP-dependent Clp protease adaptor protein ClpS
MWKVVIHNDDFTPIGFVIELLQLIFNKDFETAQKIANTIHATGKAQIGLYTKEIALTKTAQALRYSEAFQHPLLTVAEEA